MPMGYMGFAKFFMQSAAGVPSNPILLLATGASVNLTLEPIYSSAVWGAGWYNAPTTAHYGDGPLRYEGSIDIELQGTNECWNFVRDWGIEYRAFPASAEISPDGRRVYAFHASGDYSIPGTHDDNSYTNNGMYCTSLGLSTSEGSFVTVSCGAVGLHRVMSNIGAKYIDQRLGLTGCTDLYTTYPLNPSAANISAIPFWRTLANLYDLGVTAFPTYPAYTPFVSGTPFQSDIETVEWSIDLSNNQVILYTCKGTREATAVLMGAIDATGSVTMFSPSGVFDPILGPTGTEGTESNPFQYAQRTCFRVTIQRSPASVNPVYLELPSVLIEADDYGLKGQSDVCSRGFTLKGLGGRCAAGAILPPLLMSQAT
jgi:hypothetical protein